MMNPNMSDETVKLEQETCNMKPQQTYNVLQTIENFYNEARPTLRCFPSDRKRLIKQRERLKENNNNSYHKLKLVESAYDICGFFECTNRVFEMMLSRKFRRL